MTNQDPTDADDAAALAARLRLALARLNRRIRLRGPQRLTASQVATLATLATVQAAGPVRLGDLAAHEGTSVPTQSRLVASLEAEGFVAREPDPDDGRAALLRVTAAGRHELERLRSESSAYLAERMSALSPGRRRALADALEALEALAECDRPPQG